MKLCIAAIGPRNRPI